MKYRTLTPDLSPPPEAPAPASEPSAASATDDLAHLAAATQREPEASGFELVLGPLQVTSLAFVLLVVVVLCGGIAYAIGKSGSKTPTAPPPAAAQAQPQRRPIEIGPVASILLPSTPRIPADGYASLFGAPVKGQLYIQMGAVDRGMAIVFAQGLQKIGFKSTIIPGATPNIFRVILGPFPTNAEFNSAKQILDNLGVDTFARRFDDPEPPPTPAAVARPSNPTTTTQ